MRESDDRRQQKMVKDEDMSGGSPWLPSSPPTRAREIDALHDQRQLRCLDGHRSEATVGGKRRAKTPDLQTLRPHRKSVAVPVNDADAIAALREEDEQMAVQWGPA